MRRAGQSHSSHPQRSAPPPAAAEHLRQRSPHDGLALPPTDTPTYPQQAPPPPRAPTSHTGHPRVESVVGGPGLGATAAAPPLSSPSTSGSERFAAVPYVPRYHHCHHQNSAKPHAVAAMGTYYHHSAPLQAHARPPQTASQPPPAPPLPPPLPPQSYQPPPPSMAPWGASAIGGCTSPSTTSSSFVSATSLPVESGEGRVLSTAAPPPPPPPRALVSWSAVGTGALPGVIDPTSSSFSPMCNPMPQTTTTTATAAAVPASTNGPVSLYLTGLPPSIQNGHQLSPYVPPEGLLSLRVKRVVDRDVAFADYASPEFAYEALQWFHGAHMIREIVLSTDSYLQSREGGRGAHDGDAFAAGGVRLACRCRCGGGGHALPTLTGASYTSSSSASSSAHVGVGLAPPPPPPVILPASTHVSGVDGAGVTPRRPLPYCDLSDCTRAPRRYARLLRECCLLSVTWARGTPTYRPPRDNTMGGGEPSRVSPAQAPPAPPPLPPPQPPRAQVGPPLEWTSEGRASPLAALDDTLPSSTLFVKLQRNFLPYLPESGTSPADGEDEDFDVARAVLCERFFVERFAGLERYSNFLRPPYYGGCFLRFCRTSDALACLRWMRAQRSLRRLFKVQFARQDSGVMATEPHPSASARGAGDEVGGWPTQAPAWESPQGFPYAPGYG